MSQRYPPGHPLHPEALKAKQRLLRENFPVPLTLRVHRALSWLRRAEREEDADVRLILLWIGFNAAYANDVGTGLEGERERIRAFFDTLVRLDAGHRIYDVIWQRFSQEIRVLLDNRYVFSPFWAHHNGVPGHADWADKLERSRNRVRQALASFDTATLLAILFDRLYVLRNQLVHGGATWNSDVNRDQVRDGAALLGCLVPIFIDVMMDNPQYDWPMPHYPVVIE
jgi:Apea-like HEPN